MYYVYVLECSDGTLYVGSTNDVGKRILAHNNQASATKYTRTRRPVILKYTETLDSKSEALKREYRIKQLTRAQKLDLISGKPESRFVAAS